MSTVPSSRSNLGVVVGVDGSAASRVAVNWAARNAERRNLSLTLVYVPPAPPLRLIIRRRVYGQLELPHQRVRRILDDAINIVEDSARHDGPPQVITKVAFSDPLTTLADMSRDAEMVVVGSTRRTALRHMGRRSVSSALVHQSQCPVAVVHDQHPRMPHPAHGPVHVRVSGW